MTDVSEEGRFVIILAVLTYDYFLEQ